MALYACKNCDKKYKYKGVYDKHVKECAPKNIDSSQFRDEDKKSKEETKKEKKIEESEKITKTNNTERIILSDENSINHYVDDYIYNMIKQLILIRDLQHEALEMQEKELNELREIKATGEIQKFRLEKMEKEIKEINELKFRPEKTE